MIIIIPLRYYLEAGLEWLRVGYNGFRIQGLISRTYVSNLGLKLDLLAEGAVAGPGEMETALRREEASSSLAVPRE